MNYLYGIDTSDFIRLLTGDPEAEYEKTVRRFEERLEKEPHFVSNQVIGESYVALQLHYGITKSEARSAILEVLSSSLCSPLNGASMIEALQTDQGCGLLDRLIADGYAKHSMKVLTNDLKMSRLPSAQKL